jgi:hypothetical protein
MVREEGRRAIGAGLPSAKRAEHYKVRQRWGQKRGREEKRKSEPAGPASEPPDQEQAGWAGKRA